MSETALAVRAPMDLTLRIEELKKQNYNVLLPVTQLASQNELFVPRLDIVVPELDKGDFYKQGSKKVGNGWANLMAPSGQFLNKISSAANIQWHPDKCGVIDRSDNYILYRAVAALRQADGQWRTITDEYELDLLVIEDELRLDYSEKAKTKDFQDKMKKENRDLEYYIKRDLLQKRRHKVALAASGAMNRVIRKALTLRSTYLESEAKNPFAIARFDFQPDYDDPTVRRYASIAAIQAQNDLYGQGTAAMPEDVSPEETQAAEALMNQGVGSYIDITDADPETGEVTPPEVFDAEIVDQEPLQDNTFFCDDCSTELVPTKDAKGREWSVSGLVDLSTSQFDRILCPACIAKAGKEKKKAGGK